MRQHYLLAKKTNMKWISLIREKKKAIIVLFIILLGLGFANFIHKKNYAKLDKHIASIYEDRLLPSTYLFEIIEGMYLKKISLSQNKIAISDSLRNLVLKYNAHIEEQIKKYDITFLTEQEAQYWKDFKVYFNRYNDAEKKLLNQENLEVISPTNLLQMQKDFDFSIYSLNQLASIQVSVGQELQSNSKSIISGSMINMQLEIALLVILGIMAMMLVGSNKIPFLLYKDRRENLN